MTSSEEEDLDPIYVDCDELTDECVRRTVARRRAFGKKKERKMLLNIAKGPVQSKHSRSLSARSNGPGKKNLRSDLHKRHRNAQRISKELTTVLQVFDLGLPEGIADGDDDQTHCLGSLDESLDENPDRVDHEAWTLLEDVTADAFADLDLDPPSRQPSWDDSMGLALEEVVTQHTVNSNPPPFELKPHVKELLIKGEAAIARLSAIKPEEQLSDRCFSEMDIGLVLMNEIMVEMQEHCPDDQSDLSWCSASSASSLCYQRDQTLLKLLANVQTLYDEIVESCLRTAVSVTLSFSTPIEIEQADGGFSHVLKMLKSLKQVKDFELVMCCNGVGPAKVTRKRQISQAIENQLLDLSEAMNAAVCSIQDIVLQKENLEPNGGSLHRLQRSEVLQQCWEGLKESTYRLSRCFPIMKEQLFKTFLGTVTSAAASLATLQDNPEIQEVISRVRRVISVNDEDDGLTQDEVSAREWLLPCLKKLHSIANELSRQILRSRSFKNLADGTTDDFLFGLRQEFERLMLVSVAGMILITQASDQHHLPEIQLRKDCGVRMLQMMLKYDGGKLSDHSEESEQYEKFKDLTTNLLNNVLRFQTKLQMYEIAGSNVQVHEVSLSSSLSVSVFGSPMPDIPFPFKQLSDEQLESSRIGTIVTDETSSGELKDPVSVSDATTSMPSPFRNGPDSSSGVQLPNTFWPAGESSGQAGKVKSEIPSHPLSSITEPSASRSISSTFNYPKMEHFCTIKKNELIDGPRLGSGSAGQVFKMWYFNSPVAVKIMNYPKLQDTQQRLVHEARMHVHLARHPNIVQFYGQCVGMDGPDNAVGLVMELCNLGSLLQAVREARWIRCLMEEGHDMAPYEKTIGYVFCTNWRLRLKLACDVAAGMEYLHQRDIVHRDLTSYNVVLSEGGRTGDVWVAKVCDFERSRYIPDGNTIPRSDNIPNSPAWMAPEVLRNEDYSTQADVFSMGVILWEIVTLEEPWKQHFDRCIKDPYQVISLVSNDERLEIPKPTPDCIPEYTILTDLITETWKEHPNDRPTMKEFHQRALTVLKNLILRLRKQQPTD